MIEIDDILKYSQQLRLLYVEDNKEIREVTYIVLKDFFYEVILSEDGKDGLEKFKNNKIDIVITDINMPNMNGLEMSKAIKNIAPNKPILIFSAHNEVKCFIDAIKIGIEGYILKPFDIEQFIQVLYKVIKNINISQDNFEYKNSLEQQVQIQVNELRLKDKILAQQSKMASMGEMLDIIAHQWKQPLNIISMKSELICMFDKDTKTVNQDEVLECKDEIHHQIDHLLSTLSEFRNFFRMDYNIEKVNLKSILDSIALLLKDELLKNLITLELIYSDDLFVLANENDIKHLIINLINNSKEEMLEANIKNKIITIECIKVDEKIEITLKDRGRGIPQNIIDNIFDVHFTTKEKNGGTGIGLYMCKEIVRKYNGKINVSNYKYGAVFKIVLA